MCVLVAQLWLMPEIHSELIQTNTGFIAVLWVRSLALNLFFLQFFLIFSSKVPHVIAFVLLLKVRHLHGNGYVAYKVITKQTNFWEFSPHFFRYNFTLRWPPGGLK